MKLTEFLEKVGNASFQLCHCVTLSPAFWTGVVTENCATGETRLKKGYYWGEKKGKMTGK